MNEGNLKNRIDLSKVRRYPISMRRNLVKACDFAPGVFGTPVSGDGFAFFTDALPDILKGREFKDLVRDLRALAEAGRPVVMGMGGHVIKCGLGPVVKDLMETGFLTGIAMNGSTAIHDFEIAMIGETSEDVAETLGEGSFGMAEETGRLFNKAVSSARPGQGMGAALAAAIDGQAFPHRRLSVLWNAARLGLPVTVHVAMGTDIVHMHPEFDPGATGVATHRDFLTLAAEVGEMLSGGAYLNFGSAVILPEVFLKALTVARNLKAQGICGFEPSPGEPSPGELALGEPAPGEPDEGPCLPFVTANFDMLQHYRPTVNVVKRPVATGACCAADRGYAFTGHHEIMLPLLAGCLTGSKTLSRAGVMPEISVHGTGMGNGTCNCNVSGTGNCTGTGGSVVSRFGKGIVPGHRAGEVFAGLRKSGLQRLVFTNGCFDILHLGHTRYLAAARQLGDALVVAINSDDSVRRLKGQTRPINTEEVRAEMLLALSVVDFVVVFGEDTPYRLIDEIRPDLLVKGGDWTAGSIVGEDLVRSRGGEVRSLPLEKGFSSTRIIEAAGLESAIATGEAGPGAQTGGVSGQGCRPDVLAVIPARFSSTRLPGKPLADIAGKTMIERVYMGVSRATTLSRVVVATDDEGIKTVVEAFGGVAVMTRPDHPSGSDRIAEVARKWGGDLIVNVQGDEPLIDPADIDLAVNALLEDPGAMVATLATPFRDEEDPDDPSKVKVVVDSTGRALYFSRSPIPHFREGRPRPFGNIENIGNSGTARTAAAPPIIAGANKETQGARFLKHIGLYAFRRKALEAFTALSPSSLEKAEKLEQLRLLENGFSIKVALTGNSPVGVDTPEDLERVSKIIENRGKNV